MCLDNKYWLYLWLPKGLTNITVKQTTCMKNQSCTTTHF